MPVDRPATAARETKDFENGARQKAPRIDVCTTGTIVNNHQIGAFEIDISCTSTAVNRGERISQQ
jgi:hypothetical protein